MTTELPDRRDREPTPVPLALKLTEGLGAASEARSYPACQGKNCGCTDGVSHSPECLQEHEDTIDGVSPSHRKS